MFAVGVTSAVHTDPTLTLHSIGDWLHVQLCGGQPQKATFDVLLHVRLFVRAGGATCARCARCC